MTPLEEYFYYDSLQEGSSADALTVLTLDETEPGAFCREAWEQAVVQAMKRSAHAMAIVFPKSNGEVIWQSADIPSSEVLFRYVPAKLDSTNRPTEPLDVERAPGIRFWIYQAPGSSRVEIVFQFHHLTSDALGSFRFLDEVFTLYAGMPLADRPTLSLEEIEKSQKVRFTVPLIGLMVRRVLGWLNPFKRRPFELKSIPTVNKKAWTEKSHATVALNMYVLQTTFSLEATQAVRQKAKQAGATVNDWLLTTVLRTTEAWRQKTVGKRSAVRYRIAMPASVRTEAHRDVTLGNVVSNVFLDMNSRDCRKPQEILLRRVARKTRILKQSHYRNLLLAALRGLHDWRMGANNIRGGMRWFTSRRVPMETLVVSNLGVLFGDSSLPRTEADMLRVGKLVLSDILLLSPRTTGVAVTMPIGTYAGQLKVHFCGDPNRLTQADAEIWMNLFREETN